MFGPASARITAVTKPAGPAPTITTLSGFALSSSSSVVVVVEFPLVPLLLLLLLLAVVVVLFPTMMIDLTLLPRTVLWCFVSSKPSFQRVKVRKAKVTFASSSSSRGNAAPKVFIIKAVGVLSRRRRRRRLADGVVLSSSSVVDADRNAISIILLLLLLLLRGRRQSAHHRRRRHHLFRFGLLCGGCFGRTKKPLQRCFLRA